MTDLPLWPHPAPRFGIAPDGDKPENTERLEFQPSLTPFPHPDGGNRAAVIVCPGGGYWVRAPHEGAPVAQWLNSIGLHAFVLNYRVWPHRHPAPVTDAHRAIRLVRSGAAGSGVDPRRIGILGFSAGGHVAASAATLPALAQPDHADAVERVSGRPDALIACYAVLSLQAWGHQGSKNALLGEKADQELVDALSLERQVTARNPPTFLWSTSDDAAVPIDNSLMFASALRRFGVPFAMSIYPQGRHGLGLAQDHAEAKAWPSACADWLKTVGFAA